MSDEKVTEVKAAAEDVPAGKAPKPKKRRKHTKKLAIVAIIVIVIAIAGGGMYKWHEKPSFCATMCHIEQTYVNNYMQAQGAPGIDKYGNSVSNTNAMMAVMHRTTDATAMSEVLCVDCHEPNMFELAHDGIAYTTGGYLMPRDERSAAGMKEWDHEPGESFCANSRCHVYLLGDDGQLSYEKLEASTAGRAFNPHERYHGNLSIQCTDCHKGHRASTIVCTGCHQHADVELPAGWVSYKESQQILADAFAGSAEEA